MKRAPSTSSTRVLARSLKPRHGRDQLLAHVRRQFGRELGPASNVRQHALDLGEQIGIVGVARCSGR